MAAQVIDLHERNEWKDISNKGLVLRYDSLLALGVDNHWMRVEIHYRYVMQEKAKHFLPTP